jgi:toxin ParE1/3/4
MTSFALSPRAREDLSKIWDYASRRWGMDQADLYIRKIVSICTDLGSGRLQGRSAEAIRPGYRKYAAGSHVLFYRLNDDDKVEVIRILHQRMAVGRHF